MKGTCGILSPSRVKITLVLYALCNRAFLFEAVYNLEITSFVVKWKKIQLLTDLSTGLLSRALYAKGRSIQCHGCFCVCRNSETIVS